MKPIPPRLLITIYSSLFAAFHRIRECAHNRGATPRWRTPWPRSSGWSCGGRDLRVSLVSIPSYETDRGYFIASGVRHSGQRSRRRAEPCRRTCFSMLPLSASLLPWDVLLCRSGGCRREYHDRGDGDHLNGERFLACTFPGANFHHREHLVQRCTCSGPFLSATGEVFFLISFVVTTSLKAESIMTQRVITKRSPCSTWT
jgi:hypothetical protein